MMAERDRFEEIVRIMDQQLALEQLGRGGTHLHVLRWEHDAPKRADGEPNAEFVRQAESSHVTVVLLNNDIRVGTREELEAALANNEVQLAVIWMKPVSKRKNITKELITFLDDHKDDLIWDDTGPPGSDEAWFSMVRVLTRALVSSLSWRSTQAQEVYLDDLD